MTMSRWAALPIIMMSWASITAQADTYAVKKQKIVDPKVVFATVESADQAAARARIGGTIIGLSVKEGDFVEAGQEIAVVGDQKLAFQAETLDAQIASLTSQSEKANADLKRVKSLIDGGGVSQSALDAAKAAATSAANDLKARKSQRDLIAQEVTEGKILSPSFGRVLHVPMTTGSVVMPGETVATVAAGGYVLRLSIPERHAAYLKKGDKVRLDVDEVPEGAAAREGEITLVYPAIENGRVIADAVVKDMNNYFVGERIRVWVSTGERQGYLVPRKYILTKSGVDYVRVSTSGGKYFEVPVQCGRIDLLDNNLIEILSGVKDQDLLVTP